jgi:hypothetical protein
LKLVVRDRASRHELFSRLEENARAQAARGGGRKASGYSYSVPGQWQGRSTVLRVIGDKDGAKTSERLARNLDEIDRFEDAVGVPLRVVHVVRNPFDIVARMSLLLKKGVARRPIPVGTKYFADLALANERLSARRDVFTIRHEALGEDARGELRRLCEFVGVEPSDDYLDACASIVFAEPRRTREQVEWEPAEIAELERIIGERSFLAGYTFTG